MIVNMSSLLIFGTFLQLILVMQLNAFLEVKPTDDGVFRFASHFQDHMVLQQAPLRARIHGFSSSVGEEVRLRVDVGSRVIIRYSSVKAGKQHGLGEWMIELPSIKSNSSATIKVSQGGTQITLKDVLFGDVWICSGQSNMVLTLQMSQNGLKQIQDAHNYPNIRVLSVKTVKSKTPLEELGKIAHSWSRPSNESLNGGNGWNYFSAVCWSFGKEIHLAQGTPIGLIDSAWIGTSDTCWSTPDALSKCGLQGRVYPNRPEYTIYGIPQENSVCWNGMIAPLTKTTIYGVVFYQGEGDDYAGLTDKYICSFPAMISDWRQKFYQGTNNQTDPEFPFGFVQLAPNRDNHKATYFTDIRWHQTADYGFVPNNKLPNTFMAVTLDLPDFNSSYGPIHPRDKVDVGKRLSLSALNVAYKQSSVHSEGPFPVNAVVEKNTTVVNFGSKWKLDVRQDNGFEIRCSKTKDSFSWVNAKIVSHTTSSVTISLSLCDQVKNNVTGIRYAWKESPCPFKKCAIYSTVNQLPAPPSLALYPQLKDGKSVFTYGRAVPLK